MYQYDIQKQKHSLDIVGVIEQSGVELKKAGKSYSALCPFHDEKTPSFTVDTDKQLFFCFGCGAGGDVIAFVMKRYDMDFQQAIGFLGIEEQPPKDAELVREQRRQQRHEKKRKERRKALYDEFQGWVDWYTSVLIRLVDTINDLMRRMPWDAIENIDGVIRRLSTWQYHLWLIQRIGNEDLIYDLYREQNGKR